MKTLLRMTVTAVVVWACALPAPREATAQVQEPSEKLAYPWQVLVRPRAGYFAPQWQYERGPVAPPAPLGGCGGTGSSRIFLVRCAPSAGATHQYAVGNLALVAGINQSQPPIEGYQSVIADFIFYPTRTEDILPYFFVGGGMKVYTTDDAETVPFPIPFFARRAPGGLPRRQSGSRCRSSAS